MNHRKQNRTVKVTPPDSSARKSRTGLGQQNQLYRKAAFQVNALQDFNLRLKNYLDWWPVILIWSCLLLLPFRRFVEIPVALMAIGGLIISIRNRQFLTQCISARLFTYAFLLAWIPVLLSLPDAINLNSSTRVALGFLRYFLAGLFIVYCLATPQDHERFLRLAAWLLAFWVADGLIQLLAGVDLFGYTLNSGRLNALFGDRNPKYGIMLALLSPLLLEHARRHWNRTGFAVTAILTVVMVLTAGSRSSWITLGVIALCYGLLLWLREGRFPWRVVVASIAILLLIVGTFYKFSDRFSSRLDTAVAGLTGKAELTSSSIGHRIVIWKGAIRMITANPINGVGARGFRDAFPAHADPNDPFLKADPTNIPMHSHQLILELLAETGLIGLIGTIFLLVILARAGLRTDTKTQIRMLPYALCLVAAYFPINTHLAIYSTYWSQVVWYLIAIYCAAAAGNTETTARAHALDAGEAWSLRRKSQYQ